MNQEIEVLLVEDNTSDAEMTIWSLKKKPVEYDAFQKVISELGLFWLIVNESAGH